MKEEHYSYARYWKCALQVNPHAYSGNYSGRGAELDRHLVGTKIGPRSQDKSALVEDYPLLPDRRRFWKHALRRLTARPAALTWGGQGLGDED